MAEKRMLSKKITENDNFVALPATAQALYMHLTLGADDDGFCDQISVAMFRAHAKKKDLDALLNARYLLRFDSGVIVIKHWRMANANRADRYTPTAYQEEYQRLTVKSNKSYTLATDSQPDDVPDDTGSGNQLATNRQPDGNQLAPQKRIEENRREENNIYTTRTHAHTRTREDEKDDRFNAFWDAYPKKSGDIREAYMEYLHVLDNGVRPETLIEAIRRQTDGVGPEDLHYLPAPVKWLRNRGWESRASLRSSRPEARGSTPGRNTPATCKPLPPADPEKLLAAIERI